MSPSQAVMKRIFDILVALIGLLVVGWLILLAWLAVRLSSRGPGFFRQERVGKDAKSFRILKLRTMRVVHGPQTNCTSADDPRITPIGSWLRTFKIDELPQLWNVLCGDMSLVGPRPDVRGFADQLEGENRALLTLRPGITGPASLMFTDEETLLRQEQDPERYNHEVLWPRKVELNMRYLEQYSLMRDIGYIAATFLPPLRRFLLPPR
jgi:lipopolysaccharide/colanic/teichoic acid biosynthesis glycosyltransferase